MKKYLSITTFAVMVLILLSGCKKSAVKLYNYPNFNNYIAVADYKGLEFPLNSEAIQKEITETYHTNMKNAGLNEDTVLTSGTVQNGDTLTIDYEGKLNGVAFDGGTAQNASLEIGSNSFIPGFESGLIGKTIGTTVDLNLTFPEDYSNNPDLAGKAVVFTVKIHSATRPSYPELSEKMIGMVTELGYSSIEEYKNAVIEKVKSDYIWGTMIVEASTVSSYPETELQINLDYYNTAYASMADYYGEDNFKSYVKTAAENKTKEELICHYIAVNENLTVTDEEIKEAAVKQYGSQYTQDNYYSAENTLICQKAVNFALDSAVTK